MRENTALTQEINDLRRDLRFMQQEVAHSRELATQIAARSMGTAGVGSVTPKMPPLLSGATTTITSAAPPHSAQQPHQQRGRRTAALLGVLVAAPGTAIRSQEANGVRPDSSDAHERGSHVFPRLQTV